MSSPSTLKKRTKPKTPPKKGFSCKSSKSLLFVFRRTENRLHTKTFKNFITVVKMFKQGLKFGEQAVNIKNTGEKTWKLTVLKQFQKLQNQVQIPPTNFSLILHSLKQYLNTREPLKTVRERLKHSFSGKHLKRCMT